ncbi:MAG: DEAD/DEAH box helicase, partial [Acidobacteria bacterium]|nr:DEAD/DEAH box helicase [Acidobacteriota bacterium]
MNDSMLVSGLSQTLEAHNITVVAHLELPGRPAKLVPPPEGLAPIIRGRLNTLFPLGIYSHQAAGIQAALDGKDICLATPTASGKSLVFMAFAAHAVKSDKKAQVLALYPAKALIQDQLVKWKEFLGNFGLQVAHIDGGVPTVERPGILRRSHVVLMTPDVAHAWLLAKASEVATRDFLDRLNVLILDEAHVYDGVFGTNMAYFMRRLQAVSGLQHIISSTATIGEPEHFIRQLTGRDSVVLTEDEDGSANYGKTLLLATVKKGKSFDAYVNLISALATADTGRF